MAGHRSLSGLVHKYVETSALKTLSTGPIPRHVSVVIDGNRRFARERGMTIAEGHRIGYDNVEKTVNTFSRLGVPVVTVWMFSINNFRREPQQVKDIMSIIHDLVTGWTTPGGMAVERNLRVNICGRLGLLDEKMRTTFNGVMAATKDNDGGVVNLLIPYTGTDEMVQAINSVLQVPDSEKEESVATIIHRIDQEMFTGENPPLDILIRTGASRLSDFMNWQCNEQTEIEFCDCLWPEFSTWWILRVLARWQKRKLRQPELVHSGKVEEADEGIQEVVKVGS